MTLAVPKIDVFQNLTDSNWQEIVTYIRSSQAQGLNYEEITNNIIGKNSTFIINNYRKVEELLKLRKSICITVLAVLLLTK